MKAMRAFLASASAFCGNAYERISNNYAFSGKLMQVTPLKASKGFLFCRSKKMPYAYEINGMGESGIIVRILN